MTAEDWIDWCNLLEDKYGIGDPLVRGDDEEDE